MTSESKDKGLVVELIKTQGKPAISCRNCGNNTWWQRQDGGWCCQICHPRPPE